MYYGQQTDIAHLFTIDLMKHIFLNVFCENSSFDFAKLSNELFAIFLYLFKKINLKAKAIEVISGTQKYKVKKMNKSKKKSKKYLVFLILCLGGISAFRS